MSHGSAKDSKNSLKSKLNQENKSQCLQYLSQHFTPYIHKQIMSAEKGNQYWKDRSQDGRDLIWSSPDELWKECKEYFKETGERVWNKTEFRGVQAKEVKVPTSVPFSLQGLCLHLDCCITTFKNYEKKNDFVAVTRKVRNIIENQQFEGAVVGAFNASIIASKLGLANKSEVTNKNFNMNSKELSKEDMKEYNDALENDF
ncbi:MAG: terminase small subunit [Nitrosopumilus sp.]